MTDIQFPLWAYMVNSRLSVLTLMVIYHVQPKVKYLHGYQILNTNQVTSQPIVQSQAYLNKLHTIYLAHIILTGCHNHLPQQRGKTTHKAPLNSMGYKKLPHQILSQSESDQLSVQEIEKRPLETEPLIGYHNFFELTTSSCKAPLRHTQKLPLGVKPPMWRSSIFY